MDFWKKIGRTAVIAVVFGLLAGMCFCGVTYFMGKALKSDVKTEEATEIEDLGKKDRVEDVAPPTEKIDNKTPMIQDGCDAQRITEECMPSVVAITNVSVQQYYNIWFGSQERESTSAGSGVIVNEDDDNIYIVTNNHVISGASKITVTFVDEEAVEATVKGTSPSIDVAVVTVAKDDMKASTKDVIKVAKMGDSQSLKVGQDCVAIGNALGYGQSVTKGIISALEREVKVTDPTSGTVISNKLIQTDAAINPGNSGGALLDSAGNLIGINSVKFTTTSVEGMGYAIPVNTVKPIVSKFINNDVVTDDERAFLGVAGVEVSQSVVETYGIPEGLCISQIGEGSAADKAGLEIGDIIIKFNGREISTMKELQEEIEYLSAGTKVPVVVAKKADGYKETSLNIELGKKDDVTTIDEMSNGDNPSIGEKPSDQAPSEDKKDSSNEPEIKNWSYSFDWPFSLFGN